MTLQLFKKDDESVTLTKDDLFLLGRTGLIVNMAFLGLIGLGPALAVASVSGAFGLTAALFVIAVFIVAGGIRNWLLRTEARRGFRPTFRFQRLVHTITIVGGTLIIVGTIYGRQLLGTMSVVLNVPFFWAWTYYYPQLTVFSSKEQEGKLFLKQFWKGVETGAPESVWLRKGLGRVQRQLLTLGLGISRNRLFFGCSYAIFNKIPVKDDLELLGEWLTSPRGKEVNGSISWLLHLARRAERDQYEAAPTLLESVGRFPWQTASVAFATLVSAIAVLAVLITAMLALLRLLGVATFP